MGKKIAIFFQTINIEEWYSFTVLPVSLMESLIEGRWILIPAMLLKNVLMFSLFQHMVSQSNCKEPSGEGLGTLLQCTSFMIFQASSWGSSLFSADGFQIQKLAQTLTPSKELWLVIGMWFSGSWSYTPWFLFIIQAEQGPCLVPIHYAPRSWEGPTILCFHYAPRDTVFSYSFP